MSSWSLASGRPEVESALRRVGALADADIDVAETALLLAALDQPKLPLERYRHHLSLLARDCTEMATRAWTTDEGESELQARVATLRGVIYDKYGYAGDEETYDDLQNGNLMRVVDRRRGLPVALGILVVHTARSQGWDVAGLAFPGHFLLQFQAGAERIVADPFNALRELQASDLRDLLKVLAGVEAELRPEHYAPVGNREILLRLQNNLKLRHLREQRPEQALEIVESMLLFAPDQAGLWREAGLLHAHLSNLRAAIVSLEHYLELAPASGESQQAADLLRQLRGQLN
jgi:regulator of sirC expression with transglutaminase-like and TPR domain